MPDVPWGHRVPECGVLLHHPPVVEGVVGRCLLCVCVIGSHALHILSSTQAQHHGEVTEVDPGLVVLNRDDCTDRGSMAAPAVVV